ncbi:MAG TPA: hypothetical protein VMF91_17690 [Bryobacteraceae bacterium]|nr:hypothetical protein [Bryobacteraceae bacterium]
MATNPIHSSEFVVPEARSKAAAQEWGRIMVLDELHKRQRQRLLETIHMTDAIVLDVVSAFLFPVLVLDPGSRCFLRSAEWDLYVSLSAPSVQKRLWDFPLQLSVDSLESVMTPLYRLQPALRLLFHLPRPCFDDGVTFDDPELTRNLDYYHYYGKELYLAASRMFSGVDLINCGGEQADPAPYNGRNPFHYTESHRILLRKEIERLIVGSAAVS